MKECNKAGYRGEECIKRVMQHEAMPKGQHGKMSWKGDGADFKREGDSLTPRRA